MMAGMPRWAKRLLVVLGLVVVGLFVQGLASSSGHHERGDASLSSVLAAIDSRHVTDATLASDHVTLTLSGGNKLSSRFPPVYGSRLVDLLHAQSATIRFEATNGWIALLTWLLPLLPFAAFWLWLSRRLPRRADAVSPRPPEHSPGAPDLLT
jgi:hypothetical protein